MAKCDRGSKFGKKRPKSQSRSKVMCSPHCFSAHPKVLSWNDFPIGKFICPMAYLLKFTLTLPPTRGHYINSYLIIQSHILEFLLAFICLLRPEHIYPCSHAGLWSPGLRVHCFLCEGINSHSHACATKVSAGLHLYRFTLLSFLLATFVQVLVTI